MTIAIAILALCLMFAGAVWTLFVDAPAFVRHHNSHRRGWKYPSV
ncbi:hypothetical protein [Sinorhizobium fredii]|nr:hypothetical protein [Sinorhizobium fredii]ASY69357.1 hypothetical protein SF83666_c19410 [Sinorhizobium fredii CCBAU 83666]